MFDNDGTLWTEQSVPSGQLDKGLDEAPGCGWVLVDMKRDWKTVFQSSGTKPLGAKAAACITIERAEGPGRIAGMGKEATKRNLDPDKWFNNVEIVTADKVGIETTTYVRNIFKYYTTYKLMLDHEETQKKARETVKRSG